MKYFDYRDFTNLDDLVKRKEKLGFKVGVGLPVYNEEKTLRKVLLALKQCGSLIDEAVCLVDCRTRDQSAAIAKKLGIRTIYDKEIAQQLKIKLHAGKGWNLWGSLYVLKTDIIAWVDTDIKNIGPRFFVGVIGPMIVDEKIKFVKGYYHRPKNDGRVTEILVRPFLNLLLPELGGFVQPLSGEYGGRREFLKKLSFFSGYSVDSALLIQAEFLLNSEQIGQTYLGKRIHRQRDLPALGKMAVEILHKLLILAERYKRIKLKEELRNYLSCFVGESEFKKARYQISDIELSPVNQLEKIAEI